MIFRRSIRGPRSRRRPHLRTREEAEAERFRRRVPPGRPPDWTPGWDDVFIHIIPKVAWLIFMVISLTVSLRVSGIRRVWRLLRQHRGAILVSWHGRIFLPLFALRRLGIHALVSLSRDGEYLDRMFRHLGWNTIRGSTYGGPVKVLLSATRFLKRGAVLGVTPDGPRGPSRQVFPGTLYLASVSQCPILPLGVAVDPHWELPTWDRAMIPKPFALGSFVVGEPVYVPRKLNDAMLEEQAQRVFVAIERAQKEAEDVLVRQKSVRLYSVWNAMAILTSPIIATYYVWKAIVQGKAVRGAFQQLGWYPRQVAEHDLPPPPLPPSARPSPPRIWLHAVSVGETMAASAVLKQIREKIPSSRIIVSAATDAAYQTSKRVLKGADDFVYFPLDAPQCVRRALHAVHPDVFLTVETELWPNFLHLAKQQGVTTMLVNGRFSDNTLRTSRIMGPFWTWMIHNVDVFAMRSQTDFDRALQLGVPRERMRLTGDCKLDQPVRLLKSEEVEQLRDELALSPDDRVFLAGSTHAGEESLIVDAWWHIRMKQPNTRLVIAPRHTDRIPEIEQSLSARGFHTVRRSDLLAGNGNGHLTGCEVILIDTIGELVRLYAVADVAFVGGTLIKRGGHNVLEPAIQGKPVLFGPSIENFRDSARLLLDTGVGWRVQSTDDICRITGELLNGDDRLFEIRHRALDVLDRNRGAARATVDIVLELLGLAPPCPASAGPEK